VDVDEQYERLRAKMLEQVAEHERGDLDDAGLRRAVEDFLSSLDHTHGDVRQALFEADIALEYAQYGRPLDGSDPRAPLRRMRRNLREALR
jgi:hypothetical protein